MAASFVGKLPPMDAAIAFFLAFQVQDKSGTGMVPLDLNDEQREVIQALYTLSYLVVLKARQVGISTSIAAFVLLCCINCDNLPCAIVANDWDNAKGLLAKIKAWAEKLGIKVLGDTEHAVFSNGSTIDAKSATSTTEAGTPKLGKSKSYALIWMTEGASWPLSTARDQRSSLLATALEGALVIDESTGEPGTSNPFHVTWDAAPEESKLFLSVEKSKIYRASPSLITDEEWAELQADYGFTQRDSAAWWLHAATKGKYAGTPLATMARSFPVTVEQAWTQKEGLAIERAVPVDVVEDGHWNHYPGATDDEPCILGVDTAKGTGGDSSSLVFISQITGRVLRTWRDNRTLTPDFRTIACAAIRKYKPAATVVESNGVGTTMYQDLARDLGAEGFVIVEGIASNTRARDGDKTKRLQIVKQLIESGAVPIGGHLLDEANDSRQDTKGKSVGRDDCILALSWAVKARADFPFVAPLIKPDPRGTYSMALNGRVRGPY
jgi:hypothetical protein